jgi:cytochrome b involved in lipid metabolism
MMRGLYLSSTVLFWLAVAGLWHAAEAPPEPAINPPSPAEAPASPGRYSTGDVARHGLAEDCWMIIAGEVYDVSSYIPDHPTEPEILLPWCGRDASEAYRTKGKGRSHSAYADRQLAQYRIGTLRSP